jgi:hypothetical protein
MSMSAFWRGAAKRKYLILFLALIVLLAMQPLGHGLGAGTIFDDVLFNLLAGLVFLVVFHRGWQRLVALVVVLALLAGNLGTHGFRGDLQVVAVVAYHGSVAVFLGFAVVVILRDVFQQQAILADDIIGGFCGYLLAAGAWGNLYMVMEVLLPGSFSVSQRIAWQLSDWHTRRFLFNYFSFITLTTVGYGDITPASPTAAWLACLEAVFGQIYIAVVVAQIVGARLAQAAKNKGSRRPRRPLPRGRALRHGE